MRTENEAQTCFQINRTNKLIEPNYFEFDRKDAVDLFGLSSRINVDERSINQLHNRPAQNNSKNSKYGKYGKNTTGTTRAREPSTALIERWASLKCLFYVSNHMRAPALKTRGERFNSLFTNTACLIRNLLGLGLFSFFLLPVFFIFTGFLAPIGRISFLCRLFVLSLFFMSAAVLAIPDVVIATNTSSPSLVPSLVPSIAPSYYGDNWVTSNAASSTWYYCAMNSATGQYAVAPAYNSYLYYSSDYGATWSKSGSISAKWQSVDMSSSGEYAIAGASPSYLFYSSDYGVSWTQSTSVSGSYSGMAMSSNGEYAVACWSGGNIYYSSDYGHTFTKSSSIGTLWR